MLSNLIRRHLNYFNDCDSQGATCTTPDCNTAFHNSDDNQVQVACQVDNVDLLITFYPTGGEVTPAVTPQSPVNIPMYRLRRN
ncbi:hypothetical protein B0F90DRAFT_1775697 [Multifurca ochricompacta]|uniref:Uncharacterized protein n=1 Tax=Multifurca ochricompacta TaxID=376703 RepID=A0AAD4LW16_9AGAM|nr:hypothetical protein B0F90DRAFT_1775697 [Multifurca ochricompacta]